MHSEKEFSKKITFVSFVSALFVVLIHAYWVSLSYSVQDTLSYKIVIGAENFVNFLGNSYALTMFFAISSMLFFRNVDDNNLKRKLLSRAKSLIIPYLIWNALYTLFFFITGIYYLIILPFITNIHIFPPSK